MTENRVALLLARLRQRHEVHEDCWYTCPKAIVERPNDPEARCCNDGLTADICTCGADRLNADLDALAVALGYDPKEVFRA